MSPEPSCGLSWGEIQWLTGGYLALCERLEMRPVNVEYWGRLMLAQRGTAVDV